MANDDEPIPLRPMTPADHIRPQTGAAIPLPGSPAPDFISGSPSIVSSSAPRRPPHLTINSGSGGDILHPSFPNAITQPNNVNGSPINSRPGTADSNISPPEDIARTSHFESSSEEVASGTRNLIQANAGFASSRAGSRPLMAPSGMFGSGTSSAFTSGANTPIYGSQTPGLSTDTLLPPIRMGGGSRYNGLGSYASENSLMSANSRRTSYGSERTNRSSLGLPLGIPLGIGAGAGMGASSNPFGDPSRPSSQDGSVMTDMGEGNLANLSTTGLLSTQSVAGRYNVLPSEDLIQYPHEVEKDDWLHNFDPAEKDRDYDFCTPRGAVNVGGLLAICLGVVGVFLVWPLVTGVDKGTHRGKTPTEVALRECEINHDCLAVDRPLLMNVRHGLIDPDTPIDIAQGTKIAQDGKKLKLAFSDEFSKPGRTFYDGDDPYWQAVDIWYGATQDLEWYDPDAASTANGTLNLKFDAFQSHNLNYRSGMLQSWNKLCFKGGRLEASISLPGRGDVMGFWPGFWAMGNLGRPGYLATTDGMWPYSYDDVCDAGITANQSSTDGISLLPGMRLPACTCAREDHPSPGHSRSAPELDAIEASVGFLIPGGGNATGSASQSFQAAPFDIWYQPDYEYVEIYDEAVTEMNAYRGGPYQQAVSGVTWLNNEWYDGKGYQTYGFEYTPGGMEKEGKIGWFVGDSYTWKMDGRATRANGNIGARILPEEPLTIVLNFGLSNSFAQVFLADLAKLMPATMRVDHIRIWQEEGEESMGCDPKGYETTQYIKDHPEPYANANITLWKDTKYDWPQNTLLNSCKMEN